MKKLFILIMLYGCGKDGLVDKVMHIPRDASRVLVGYDESQENKVNKKLKKLEDENKKQDEILKTIQLSINNINSSILDINNSVSSLDNSTQSSIQGLIHLVLSLQSDLTSQSTTLSENLEALNELSSILNVLQNLIPLLQDDVDSLQQAVNSILVDLVSFDNSVTDIYDPCGDTLGVYDEVILKTKSGKFLAYFENGNKRFLSVLSEGNYGTTDGTGCSFSIVSGIISPAIRL